MALDIENMQLPAPAGEEASKLDLSEEQGMGGDVSLKDASDEEILAEAEARGLIDPEEAEAGAESVEGESSDLLGGAGMMEE